MPCFCWRKRCRWVRKRRGFVRRRDYLLQFLLFLLHLTAPKLSELKRLPLHYLSARANRSSLMAGVQLHSSRQTAFANDNSSHTGRPDVYAYHISKLVYLSLFYIWMHQFVSWGCLPSICQMTEKLYNSEQNKLNIDLKIMNNYKHSMVCPNINTWKLQFEKNGEFKKKWRIYQNWRILQ